MALRYGFYNSVGEDRLYDADELSEFFDGIIGDGVLQGVGSAFSLTASGDSITVGSGRAWFDKTWTYNDSNLVIDLPTASEVNHRIDSLILEVDKRIESRENRIYFVLGTPSSSPVAPVLTPSTNVYQYPLGDVYRARDVNTITQANITRRVGTSVCPYASNILINMDQWDMLSYKRKTVRGTHLGSTMTTAQKNAIKNGSFDGLYLGDYWTHGGVNWRIVDFDYWMGRRAHHSPEAFITHHHVVIVPDDVRPIQPNGTPFSTARNASNCGWYYASSRRDGLAAVANASKPLFGSNGLLTRSFTLQSTFSKERMAMNVQTLSGLAASPISEMMLHGGRNLGLPSADHDVSQLALYSHGPQYFFMGQDQGLTPPDNGTWLWNMYSIGIWTCYHRNQGSTAHSCVNNTSHQIRPVFGVTGR